GGGRGRSAPPPLSDPPGPGRGPRRAGPGADAREPRAVPPLQPAHGPRRPRLSPAERARPQGVMSRLDAALDLLVNVAVALRGRMPFAGTATVLAEADRH